jgi:hypothetical protein
LDVIHGIVQAGGDKRLKDKWGKIPVEIVRERFEDNDLLPELVAALS